MTPTTLSPADYSRRLVQRLREVSPRTLALGAMLVVALFAFGLRVHHIRSSMPYPGHVDEPALVGPATAILKTGDFNPHYLTYPSLPIYLISGGLTLGFLDAARHVEVRTTKDLAVNGFPYYTQSRIMMPPRLLFAFLSVLGMVLIGLTAWRAFDDLGLLFLAPLVLTLSSEYAFLSQQYLNVDIVGAFTVALVYAYLFLYRDRQGFLYKSVIPGLLSGLAMGSKYNMALVLLPALLVILFYGVQKRLAAAILLCLMAVVGFLITTPYSLLDFSAFLDALGGVFNHYARGHPGHEAEAGWRALISYLASIRRDMGWASVVLAALGVVRLARQNWRHAIILLSFPVLLVFTMSQQTTFFVRNIIPVFMFYAVFVAAGASWIYLIIAGVAAKYVRRPWVARGAAVVVVALLLTVALPSNRVRAWAFETPDTRTQAAAWIRSNAAPKETVIVPEELGMDIRSLAQDYNIVVLPFAKLGRDDFYRVVVDYGDALVLMPQFDSSRGPAKDKGLGARLNSFAEGMSGIFTLDGKPVSFIADYYPPVPQGDPKITISRLALTEDMKAKEWRDRVFDLTQLRGPMNVLNNGAVSLVRNVDMRTPQVYLPAGSYRMQIDASGTTVDGVPAILEVWVADKLIEKFETSPKTTSRRLEFQIDAPVLTDISIRFLNSGGDPSKSGGTPKGRTVTLRRLELAKVK